MMVHRHACESCENSVDVLHRDGDLMCGECADVMEFEGTVGCVTGVASTPNRKLEKYIANLRHNSVRRSFASFDTDTAENIADDLEDLMEGEKDAQEVLQE